jgi:hypothetical protein
MKGSPLLGYNNNVRHRGKLYHIQTEDSGLKHPHVITHLFADGGRIISSRKTGYAEHVGADNCKDVVKKLMQEQHKAMFIALKSGEFEEAGLDDEGPPSSEHTIETTPNPDPAADRQLDVDALERAAARLSTPSVPEKSPGMYQMTHSARASRRPQSEPAPESIFGKDLLSEKSLDEVILSYLSEDLEETD